MRSVAVVLRAGCTVLLVSAGACASQPALPAATASPPKPQRFVEPPVPEVEFTDPERRAKIAATFPPAASGALPAKAKTRALAEPRFAETQEAR